MPRGGARENSGRKPKWNLGETKAVRVPMAIADTILDIARRLDDGEKPESIVIPRSEVTTSHLFSDELGELTSGELESGREFHEGNLMNTYSLTFEQQSLTKLTLNVLVENEKEGSISATVLGLPDCKVMAATRQEALDNLRQLLTARLGEAEILSLDIERPEHKHFEIKVAGK